MCEELKKSKISTIHQVGRNYKRKRKFHCSSYKSLCGSPQREGVVEKIKIVSPKKPNSAKRKVARIKLSTKYKITARVVGQGYNLQPHSVVLVRGGRANDLPGVRFTIIKGVGGFSWKENIIRIKSRSKYGIPLDR